MRRLDWIGPETKGCPKVVARDAEGHYKATA